MNCFSPEARDPAASRGRVIAAALCWLLAGGAAVPASSLAASPRELLDEAVAEYQEALDCGDRELRLAKFRRAELLFARLARGSREEGATVFRNANLHVNLGNAALGAERLGAAILAYRRALLLDPDHRRGRQNLLHARTLLPEWVPRPSEGGLFDTFFAWTRRLSRRELQQLAAAAFLLSAMLLAGSIRWHQSTLRNLAVIPAIVWILMLAPALFWEAGSSGDAAVVIVPEVIARAADSAGAPQRLGQPLPAGTEVVVIESRAEWVRVRLFDGRDAWLPTSAIELVSAALRLNVQPRQRIALRRGGGSRSAPGGRVSQLLGRPKTGRSDGQSSVPVDV